MKKGFTLAVLCGMLFSLAACSGENDSATSGNGTTPSTAQTTVATTSSSPANAVADAEGWPDNAFTQLIPKPQCSFSSAAMNDTSTCWLYPDWTLEESKTYATGLGSSGFVTDGDPVSNNEDMYMVILKNADQSYQVTVVWDAVDGGSMAIKKLSK